MNVFQILLITNFLSFSQDLTIASNASLSSITALFYSQISPPPDLPEPGTPESPQTGGAPRPGDGSKCPDVSISTIAFTPSEWETEQPEPVFWFYLPYTKEQIYSVSFKVLDDEDNPLFTSTTVQLSATPGFISLRLPNRSKKLERGKTYRWYFKVYCNVENSQDRIDYRGIFTWVEADPNLPSLAGSSWQSQVDYHLQNQDCYKAFSILATLRQTSPNDESLKNAWTQLFLQFASDEDIDREKWLYISEHSISPCCSFSEDTVSQ